MDKELKLLRDSLASILKINFRGINTGYEKIEDTIVASGKIPSFTAEQWKAITSYKYSYLFQHGIPHVSWHTDREYIFREIQKTCILVNEYTIAHTWSKETVYTYKTPAGVKLTLSKDEPYYHYDTFGYHPTQYKIDVNE